MFKKGETMGNLSIGWIHDCSAKVSMGINGQIEQKVQMVLKPRPRWMPDKLYRFILNQIIELRYFHLQPTRRSN